MTVHFVVLFSRTNDGYDCIKTFNTFESHIMVFGNIFGINIVLINNIYYCSKNVTF